MFWKNSNDDWSGQKPGDIQALDRAAVESLLEAIAQAYRANNWRSLSRTISPSATFLTRRRFGANWIERRENREYFVDGLTSKYGIGTKYLEYRVSIVEVSESSAVRWVVACTVNSRKVIDAGLEEAGQSTQRLTIELINGRALVTAAELEFVL